MWKQAMTTNPKLVSYQSFKKKLELENYLISEKEKTGRYLLTSLRVGTNKLRIETGRWKRPIERREERVCTQCNTGNVEDEKHFLLECPRYEQLRTQMFQALLASTGTHLEALLINEQWKFVMEAEKKPGQKSDTVKRYVRRAMQQREVE